MNTGTSGGSGWTSWSAGQEAPAEEDTQPVGDEDEGEFINPMAALSLGGPRAASTNDYQPPKRSAVIDEDDDEDMGFGNSSLSRNRTPKPAAAAGAQAKTEEKKAPVEDKKPEAEKRKLLKSPNRTRLTASGCKEWLAWRLVWQERRFRVGACAREAGRGKLDGL